MAKIPVHHSNEPKSKKSTDEVVDELEKSEESPQEDETPKETHLHTIEQPNALKRFGAWFWRKKIFTIPLLLIAIVGVLLVIPVTRYLATSWFWKESFVVEVIDDNNGRPVTEATVKIADQSVKTDSKGKAKFTSIPVGMQPMEIKKKYYQTQKSTVEVPLLARGKEFDTKLHATARFSEVTITNRISGKAVKAALITVSKDDQARTDESGKAQVVVPVDKKEITATVTVDGYLETKVAIKQVDKNNLQLTPVGKLYFLSKQRGIIDVAQTNLDGTDRRVVVEGTGQEDDRETTLLASRDWKYLLLKAKREAGKQAYLYLYNTEKDSFELIDQGNASFNLIGWSGHNFFYNIERHDRSYVQNGQVALKLYNAETRKITVADENQSLSIGFNDYYKQSLRNYYIVGGGVVYTKTWDRANIGGSFASIPTDKSDEIVRIGPDGTGKKVLKSFPSQTISYIEAKLYEPQEVFYRINKENDAKPLYAEIENGVYREGVDGSKFDTQYPTFVISPSGSQSFWSESRDGKNTLLLGGKNAENKQEVASKSDYTPYGWFTDEYLLMQKANSELYVMTASQLKAGVSPLKVSDYHKAATLSGYGYGYGGQ